MSSIIFVQLLLALRVINSTTDTWRQCSEWLPLDLLSFVVEKDPSRLAAGLQLQQAAGLRGLRLTSPHGSMSFPSSQLLLGCHLLPKNFSIVVTLRVPRTAAQRSEYILSLTDRRTEQRAPDGKEEEKGGGKVAGPNVVLALKVSSKRLRFTVKAERGPREQWVFGGLRLADGHWHTLVLSVAQQQVALTLDCSRKQSFSRPGSTELNMEEATFHIGSRGKWEGLFSGLLRQLVLVPASDAAQLICPSLHPQTAALSVPPLLLDLSSHEGVVDVDGASEREQRVRVGRRKSCSQLSEAELWFDPLSKGLYLCDGAAWTALLQDQGRLDYLLEHQVLGTSSETQDIELFHLPGVGVMAAMAQLSEASGSALYQWTQGGFRLFQKISSSGALAWRHFEMGKKVFLVMSNSGGCSQRHGDGQDRTHWDFSVIYKWSKRRKRFLQLQTLKTHCARDWEAFAIHGHSFLAVANHRTGDNNHTISSVIYKWNRSSMSFEVHQTLQTSGAYDWEFFSVGAFHFLAVANAFDGVTTSLDSAIYIWLNGSFQLFQTIKTFCATDWEMFEIGGRVFLAVANGQRLDGAGPALYAINSTLYELDMSHRMFVRFQDILTYSAVDWEFFSLGDQHFLVVANSFNGESYSLNSVLYRWQGYEGFVPVHWLPTIGCSDWEFFSSEGQSYLIYSSAKAPLSKVFQLKLY